MLKAYSSKDAQAEFLGNRASEFTIKYGIEQENTLNFSAGSKEPTSFSEGNLSYPDGTLMLGMADQVAVEAAARKAGLKRITDLPPFPIVVSFINSDQRLVQDVVTAKFKTDGRDVGENNTLRYEHTIFITGIDFDVPL